MAVLLREWLLRCCVLLLRCVLRRVAACLRANASAPPSLLLDALNTHARTRTHAKKKTLDSKKKKTTTTPIQMVRREPALDPLAADLLSAREQAWYDAAPNKPHLVEHKLRKLVAAMRLPTDKVFVCVFECVR